MTDRPEIGLSASSFSVETLISKDGTTIGYRKYGTGPGLVLVQGAMQTAHNYDQLAAALATGFTVYVPDRRGRGMSLRAYGADHDIQRDIEDLEALLERTGAHFVFGLSSGAIITIAATLQLDLIQKAVLFEPPFNQQGLSRKLVARFNQEVEQGKLHAALVTAGRTVRLNRTIGIVPRPLLQLGTKRFLRQEQRKGTGKYTAISELIPAMRYDFNIVGDMDQKVGMFKTLKKEVLLLGGSQSPRYLKEALTALAGVLPNARRQNFDAMDHSGPWNSDRGGKPAPIAQAISQFLREPAKAG